MKNKDPKIKAKEYNSLLAELVNLVEANRAQAVINIQNITNKLYWEIGALILEKQNKNAWGRNIVEKLSLDLRNRLGAAVSWSPRNLWFMRQLVFEYMEACKTNIENKNQKNLDKIFENALQSTLNEEKSSPAILKRKTKNNKSNNDLTSILSKSCEDAILKRKIYKIDEIKELVYSTPWRQNILILQKVKDIEARIFYLKLTVKNKYTTSILEHQIISGAYENFKEQPLINNFSKTLPEYLFEQTAETIKSVYCLDFLNITDNISERNLEANMVERVKRLMLELGYGFCFIGNQYKLNLGKKEYFVDLLFYHRIIKCLVAVELKTKGFEPEFVGKLDFYLQLVDEQLKQPDDKPSIGILLVPSDDKLEVEYALRGVSKPIGVAQYKLTKNLPGGLKGKLPSAKDFQSVFELIDVSNHNKQ